jgi:glycosyltransferase involved in cell wall biosynthesis
LFYPYWCLEKGYGRYTGPNDASPAWTERALGWMKVMRYDVWFSMIIYTFATISFYMVGASVLGRTGLYPEGNTLIRYLAVMYEPAFGKFSVIMFLIGAFAVLYSTYFVASASHARVFADSWRVFGIMKKDNETYQRAVAILSALIPLFGLVIFLFIPLPLRLVLFSGLMQAIMLPILSLAAIYFRYFRTDRRLAPSPIWDIFLWISAIGMLVAATWGVISNLKF